jgi:hypothetical protein
VVNPTMFLQGAIFPREKWTKLPQGATSFKEKLLECLRRKYRGYTLSK